MTLYLLNYNNYYNRIVKRLETIKEYEEYVLGSFTGINFNPNDGVTAEQILNYDGEMPDYCLIADEADNIVSRWFVMESKRLRLGQYRITLLRDVVADWRDEILNAPCFIEKASLGISSPFIFNNEDMTFNQIKQSETKITDNSNTAWYCLYINKNVGEVSVNIPSGTWNPDITVSTIENYSNYTYITEDYKGDYINDCLVNFQYRNIFNSVLKPATFRYGYNLLTKAPQRPYDTRHTYDPLVGDGILLREGVGAVSNSNDTGGSYLFNNGKFSNYILLLDALTSEMSRSNHDFITDSYSYTGCHSNATNALLLDNGKIILDQTSGKYYKVNAYETGTEKRHIEIAAPSGLGNALQTVAANISANNGRSGSPFTMDYQARLWRIVLEELPDEQKTITIKAGRAHCVDAPYDIVMIPKDVVGVMESAVQPVEEIPLTETGYCQQFINLVQLQIPKEDLYDIQLLPYCPINNLFTYNPGANTASYFASWVLEINVDYSFDEGVLLLYPKFSQFNTYLSGSRYRITIPNDPVEFKIFNECNMYRLCSPNYNGQFEFSVAKNKGLNGFNISCSYKPFQPYIKVAPYYQGLYGQNFNDARGLICGGDFSLAQISTEWQSYERNNKNFQVMFDRQIQNMEVNNSVARKLEKWSVGTGVVSGAVSGAIGGSMMGGGYAGIAGGIIGGGASLLGGLADIELNEKLRQEAIDYTKDQFGYQLGNIQALPYNLTKVSAQNIDNKIFPFLEAFSCTEEEKEALREKIKYNGMSVGAISTMNAFIQQEPSYIKGKIIRLENIVDDFHITNVIANEINKGVYI